MGRNSNWNRQHAADEDFTQAAWDTLVDLEKTYRVRVQVHIVPSQQRGVWVLLMMAESTCDDEHGRVVSRYQSSYPNGTAAALSSYLFSAMSSFYMQVSSARVEEYRLLCDLRGGQV
jgi:uncharacterized lipoprotein